MASIRLFLLCLALLTTPVGTYAADVTLAWDPNGEADLNGYGVYYKQGVDGPPYDLFGYFDKTELADPNSPTFTITGLNQGAVYYFAVTAFDSADNESAYSASVCAQVNSIVTPCGSTVPNTGTGASTTGGSSTTGTNIDNGTSPGTTTPVTENNSQQVAQTQTPTPTNTDAPNSTLTPPSSSSSGGGGGGCFIHSILP